MQIEIEHAVTFLGRLMYSKMDDHLISSFQDQLAALLQQRYANHWDPQQPYRGNGFRAITNFNGQLDPLLTLAAERAIVSPVHVHAILPRDFVLWIDPFSVSYRVGDHGNIMTLFEDVSRGRAAVKQDAHAANGASPLLAYLQQTRVSTPIRISPPSSPGNKHPQAKTHLFQSSPLVKAAKEQVNEQPLSQVADTKPQSQSQQQGSQQWVMAN